MVFFFGCTRKNKKKANHNKNLIIIGNQVNFETLCFAPLYPPSSNSLIYEMSIAQWRQFNFFDKQQVIDPSDNSKSPAVFQGSDISVITSGRGQISLADSKGQVYISDRNFKTHSFIAYSGGRVTHLKQLKQRNVLVTVGKIMVHQ
ncbi:hypothetical protein BDC45DRAFT_62359 [Circinella umbellata]|nr:hypothetical protein BDC45DRAFT_62359 [Circinella umbellata]